MRERCLSSAPLLRRPAERSASYERAPESGSHCPEAPLSADRRWRSPTASAQGASQDLQLLCWCASPAARPRSALPSPFELALRVRGGRRCGFGEAQASAMAGSATSQPFANRSRRPTVVVSCVRSKRLWRAQVGLYRQVSSAKLLWASTGEQTASPASLRSPKLATLHSRTNGPPFRASRSSLARRAALARCVAFNGSIAASLN